MKRLASLLIILTIPAASQGQVEVPASVKAKVGKLTQIVIKNVPAKTAWTFIPADNIEFFREHEPDQKVIKLRFVAESPGTYYLLVATANGDVKQHVCTIMVSGVAPDPPPVDPPSKLVKHLSFVGPNQATAGVVNDAALRQYLAGVGVKVHVVLAADIPAKMQPHVAAAGGIPVALLQDSEGNVLATERLTTSEAAKNLVKNYLGR